MWHSISKEEYELGKERGIDPRTLAARVYYYKYDIDKALSKPIHGHQDEEYGYWLGVARENDISQSLFSYRIHKKRMAYEQAATTPKNKNRAKRRKVSS